MATMFLLASLLINLAPLPKNPNLPDGFHEVVEKGPGTRFELIDGTSELIGKRLVEVRGSATLKSLSNDNQKFGLTLKNAPSLWDGPEPLPYVLIIDNVGLRPSGYAIPNAEGNRDYYYRIEGAELAKRLAKKLNGEVIERKDPGHRLQLKWIPSQEQYKVGEEIVLTMELKNIGKESVSLRSGGSQRGARDNDFRFIAQGIGGEGKGIPDTGDPNHHGGLSGVHEIKPGESMKKTVILNRWFKLDQPDIYRITGVFPIHLVDPNQTGFDQGIWDDLICGECRIHVVK